MNLEIHDDTFSADEKRAKLIEYLKVKVQECDWRGVSDAANELRVLEAANPKRA
jgi:hypothetical protein